MTGLYRDLVKTAKKKSILLSLTENDLKTLYQEQAGNCSLTGLMMTANSKTGGKRMPVKNVSVDLVDSSRGYVPGNVRLVCSYITLGKEKLTAEERVKMIGALSTC